MRLWLFIFAILAGEAQACSLFLRSCSFHQGSPSPFTVDRGDLGNALRDFFLQRFASSPEGVSSLVQGLQKEGAQKYAMNMALAYADSQAQAFVSSLAREFQESDPSFIKSLSVHYTPSFTHSQAWTVELSTLLSLWETRQHLLFSQIRMSYAEKRPTLNVGLGVRTITKARDLILGANAFFDRDFKGQDNRFSLGVEGISSYLHLSLNAYRRLSSWHDSPFQQDPTSLIEERPANGWDMRLGVLLPFAPQLSVTARYFQWKGRSITLFSHESSEGTKDPTGYAFGLTYKPGPFNFGIEYAHGENNPQKDLRVTAGLRITPGERGDSRVSSWGGLPLRDVSSHLYDDVERENRIILEKRHAITLELGAHYVFSYKKLLHLPFQYEFPGVVIRYQPELVKSITWSFPPSSQPLFQITAHHTLLFHVNSLSQIQLDTPYPFTLLVTLKNGRTLTQHSDIIMSSGRRLLDTSPVAELYKKCLPRKTLFLAKTRATLPVYTKIKAQEGAHLLSLSFVVSAHHPYIWATRNSVGDCTKPVFSNLSISHTQVSLPSLSFPDPQSTPDKQMQAVRPIQKSQLYPLSFQQRDRFLRSRDMLLHYFRLAKMSQKLLQHRKLKKDLLNYNGYATWPFAHFLSHVRLVSPQVVSWTIIGFRFPGRAPLALTTMNFLPPQRCLGFPHCYMFINLNAMGRAPYLSGVLLHEYMHVLGYGEDVAYDVYDDINGITPQNKSTGHLIGSLRRKGNIGVYTLSIS